VDFSAILNAETACTREALTAGISVPIMFGKGLLTPRESSLDPSRLMLACAIRSSKTQMITPTKNFTDDRRSATFAYHSVLALSLSLVAIFMFSLFYAMQI
jgi:hypothetical protein